MKKIQTSTTYQVLPGKTVDESNTLHAQHAEPAGNRLRDHPRQQAIWQYRRQVKEVKKRWERVPSTLQKGARRPGSHLRPPRHTYVG